MKLFGNKDWIRIKYAGLCAALVVLVLIAMFVKIDNLSSLSGLGAKDVFTHMDFDISFSQGIRLMLLGVFSGVVGGMMGMGGGVIKVSGLLIIFGMQILLVRSISLITNVFIYGSAAYKYISKNELTIKKVAQLMIPGALIGVVFGFILGNVLYMGWLQRLLGMFAVYSGLDMMRRMYFKHEEYNEPLSDDKVEELIKKNKLKIAGAGVPVGTFMGLFGISGGVFNIPYQKVFLKMPIKNAIANSSITSFTASLFAVTLALWHAYSHGQYGLSTPIFIALWIIPGNIAGSLAGAFLTGVLPSKFINIFYIVIMLIIGIRLFF